MSDGTCRVGRVSAQDHAEATDTVTTASRHYLAAEHLWGAQDNARRARGLEGSLVGKVVFSPEHRACVSGSILLSVAFLEALVNEVFEDADDSVKKGAPNSRVASLGTRCLELMAESWAVSERGWSTLEKYQMSLLYADKPRFDPGRNPCQDVVSVASIRNDLIHFKPRWHQHGGVDRLEQRLTGKFDTNPFLAGTGTPWFSGKVLSAGCAEWAHTACRNFADEWSDLLGLPRHYSETLAAWERNAPPP